ncbi:MAG: hypothetical protein ABIP93_16390 [Gemmatimonadaceae bacterium]
MTTSIATGRSVALLAALTLAASTSGAQQASARPPVRPLGAALATSDPMGAVSAVRQLPDGKLLVNDPVKRRVVLLDSMMKTLAIVADTTPATANAYGARGGGILPFRGDSTLFLDPASLSMLVIDPKGVVARVMAAPRPDDVFSLVGGALGFPGFDSKGRLVYRASGLNFNRRGPGGGAGAGGAGGGGGFQPPVFPDSAPLVRFDLTTRKLDTAAYIKVQAPKINFTEVEGRRSISMVINPLPEVDDWAVLSDGTIAIVRKDYHVDYIDADGTRSAGARIPFDWQRLSDSAKSAVIDTARAQMERARTAGPGAMADVAMGGGGGGAGGGFGVPFGGGGGGGGFAVRIRGGGEDGPPPPRRDATGGAAPAAGGGRGQGGGRQLNFVPPTELPDYRPAFTNGSVRADAGGKLWVRLIPTKPTTGGPEYDVIDRSGKLVDRVTLPAGTVIAGFGAGGIVYLGVRDAAGTHVVRAREK